MTDEATADSIKDWFRYRYPCTGDLARFKVYYKRQLRKYAGKYNAMGRIEGIDSTIDPMVNRYFEQLYRSNASDENTKKYGKTSNVSRETSNVTAYGRTSKDGGTITDTTAYGKITSENGTLTTATDYGKKSTSSTDVTDNTQNVADEKRAEKQTPMSADGSISTAHIAQAGEGGTISNVIGSEDWTTATAYGQTTEQSAQSNTHKGSNTAQDSGTDTQTETRRLSSENSGIDTNTRNLATTSTQGGEDTVTGTETAGTAEGGADSYTGSTMTKETNRYTGREQLTPQEALQSAIEYLQTISPAFEWLCEKMEPVFYAFFEID